MPCSKLAPFRTGKSDSAFDSAISGDQYEMVRGGDKTQEMFLCSKHVAGVAACCSAWLASWAIVVQGLGCTFDCHPVMSVVGGGCRRQT